VSGFIVVAVAMTALAVVLLVRPLLARRSSLAVERAGANLAILKDQLAELDADLRAGTLDPAQHRESKAELERRVLAEVKAERAQAGTTTHLAPRAGARTAMIAAVVIPLAAAALYWQLGHHDALDPEKMAGTTQTSGEHQITPQQLEEMVGRLAQRLEQEPENANGWAVLARSYYVMQRFPEAAAAYERLAKLAPADADVLADQADALAMAQGRSLAGRPAEIIQQALQADPNHWKALALAGSAAFERRDYRGAITYWERLLAALPADSPIRDSIASSLKEARDLGALKSGTAPLAQAPSGGGVAAPTTQAPPDRAAAAKATTIRGTVALAPGIAAMADPNDTVFIFARAADGPRMPLAIVRRQVKDLPATFALDDSMAMSPGINLSSVPRVVVGARVSRNANAVPQPGDLEGHSAPVPVGAADVAVVIDKVVP
jgi:cytochrome c-type biogenesis protein CcmH